MKLLNNLALSTKTNYSDYGDILSELGHIDFYGKYRPVIYYEKGISEIDQLFNGKEGIHQKY